MYIFKCGWYYRIGNGCYYCALSFFVYNSCARGRSASLTYTADESELDSFYNHVKAVIWNETPFDKFLVGDFDAKLETANVNEYRIGKFGIGERNENRNRIVGLLPASRLFHENSFFKNVGNAQWKWQFLNGRTYAKIDHILMEKKLLLWHLSGT